MNRSTLGIAISQENELLLLTCPEAADAFAVEFDHPERDVPLVEHDDLVLVGSVVDDMAQGQEAVGTGEDGRPPRGIALVRDHDGLVVAADRVVQGLDVVVLVRTREMILVQLDRHPHGGSHHPFEQLHVAEHPLVPHRRDPEVPLEQRVEAVEKELDRGQEIVRGRSQSSSAQEAESEAKRDQERVLLVIELSLGLSRLDGAVGDPVVVDVDKGVPGDAGHPEVKVLVYVHVEQRIEVDKVLVLQWFQCFVNGLILEPLLELGRVAAHVEDDALDVVADEDLPEVKHLENALGRVVGN